MKIEIHTTFGGSWHGPDRDTSLYWEYLIQNFTKLSSKQHELIFVGHAIDGRIYNHAQRLLKYPNVFVKRAPDGMGSTGHGHGMQSTLNFMKSSDSDVFIITDSDCAMIKNNWDIIACEAVHYQFDVIGTTYENVGGITSGNGDEQTYKHVPNACWMAFARKNKDIMCTVDPLPDKSAHLIIDENTTHIFNLPVKTKLIRDAGFRFPYAFAKYGLKTDGFKHVKSNHIESVLKNVQFDYCEEYHFKNIPFVAHQRGSLKFRFRQDTTSIGFYNDVEKYVKEQYGIV